MFSCCACTRPSKLDTEEVKSDETSDSDEDDESLEEDEKSDNDDDDDGDESSDDEMSNENNDGTITKKVKDNAHNSPKTNIIKNGSSTKIFNSSPQNSSTSTEILSQEISIENQTKNDFEQISCGQEIASSPTDSQNEVEYAEILPRNLISAKDDSQEIDTTSNNDEVSNIVEKSSEDSIVDEKFPILEKMEDNKLPSPEETSNKSLINLPEPVKQFSESKKIKEQIFQREMSQSFDDEDPSPENSSNTGSVVHIPSSIPDNEVIISPKKLSIIKIDTPSPEKDVSNFKKNSTSDENISSPENRSIKITDNEAQEISSVTPPLENQIFIPPSEVEEEEKEEDFGQPPNIEGFDENMEIIQPPDDENFSSPPPPVENIPIPETDDNIILSDSGYFIPPPEIENFLPKINDENHHQNIDDDDNFLLPPQQIITEDLIPPQDYEDFIPPPQNDGFLSPPPENEEFLPPPINDIMTSPSPENLVLSLQKSPSFDSDVPSPQNTWTSSSTDDEKRAIEITEFIGIAGNLKRDKSPLHHAPAYIERTIDDGPEDEGDDSVFESYPTPPPPPEIDFDSSSRKSVPPPIPQWLSQEDDDENISEGYGGMQEPPATPVARDELALRRHRFFSDLLQATRNSAEHRVSFDPLGPTVHLGCESDERDEHLEELVTRLEKVTRRLERVPQGTPETQEIAVQTKTPSPEKSPSPKKSSKDSISSEDQCSQGSTSSISSAASSIVEINNMSVAGYEELVGGPVQEYLALSQKIGGDVTAHSQLVEKVFQIQLAFIRTTSTRPAPANQTEQVSLLGPTSTQIQQIQEFRDKHRASPFFNHLSAISESIPALGWVAVSPTPAPYVKEMNDAGQFYTNRVLKDWKEKDKTHVDWCKAWIQTLAELQQYVRKHHTTGLVWAKGGAVPPPPAGVPPPPPSMPLGDVAPVLNDDRSALFAQINQGENITRNLKKVTSDMQTHKNHNLRTGPAPFKAPATANSGSPMKTTLPANAPIDKPPVFTRDGKKWLVEYHKGNKNLVVENAEMNNVIYMFRCQESTLVVKGKVNSVVMDSCRKSSVVFDSLVSSIEFVNCQSVQMQVLGKVPTISVDKTDGCQMYLNQESMNVEIISSKSSEMNVMVPKGNGDYTELAVPEQFKTTLSPKGLTTVAVDSLG